MLSDANNKEVDVRANEGRRMIVYITQTSSEPPIGILVLAEETLGFFINCSLAVDCDRGLEGGFVNQNWLLIGVRDVALFGVAGGDVGVAEGRVKAHFVILKN